MTAHCITTATGTVIDLLQPRAEQIDFVNTVAPVLARTARFGGHLPAGSYSVAQHCVLGVRAIIAETGDIELARAFLLHDAHEAYLQDMIRPVQAALAAVVSTQLMQHGLNFDIASRALPAALESLKDRADAAIYAAAGVEWPLPRRVREGVKLRDNRMLVAEARQLMNGGGRNTDLPNVPPAKLLGRIKVWPWPDAADAWLETFTDLKLGPVAEFPAA